MFRPAALLAAAALLCPAFVPAADPGPKAYPPPKSLGPVETYGANIQRAMTLLETSTALKRNTVRVLFYGQSITADDWWKPVADHLRRTYPLADLVIENRAILGFGSPLLVKTAEADLYPFYPDLVIFQVYGHQRYEDIIRGIRERTTADILHATEHLCIVLGDRIDEETDPAKLTPESGPPWMNHVFLPGIAKKYRTELADVRHHWKRYMRDYRLDIRDLLCDDIHLNDHGNYLMSEIIKAHLRHRPDVPAEGWKERVQTLLVGEDIQWVNGKLILPFDGNRVELVCRDGSPPAPPAAVRIDGRKPSEFRDLYVHGRTYMPWPRTHIPPLLRVQAQKPLVVEEWVARLTDVSPDRRRFRFSVRGSETGEDGSGEVGKRFVSRSGRVVIDPEDWTVEDAILRSRDPGGTEFEVRWSVVPLFADDFAVPARKNPFGETVVVAASGLPNGRHTLEVRGGPETPIAAVRVYRPEWPR